ncbi:hypothetical protein BpHYR1_035949 [Brachionus plicatilis]|uniref:Uncharacterized protein n=1 Tax=Brachionus plicatilis TaxID=10195 RepID=A0A3M7QRS5_BRAPC|nr:hypothetical protein BpHYR1_035949 [Brachionus plicatilis]
MVIVDFKRRKPLIIKKLFSVKLQQEKLKLHRSVVKVTLMHGSPYWRMSSSIHTGSLRKIF